MGLWDKIRGEFIDVIEWTDDDHDVMVYRFERHGNEIKYGAQLTVRESQSAVFINEGELADVFEPGMYTLETANLPILSTLQGWKHGFESPFKAEIYFVSMKRFTDLKWGTKNPIMLRDPEFGPVRIRAFGTYVTRIVEPAAFIREISGTDGRFTTDEVTDQLRNMIVSRFPSILAEANIPVLDLAANYDDLGEFLKNALAPEFAAYGLELAQFNVENISLPPAVEEAMDKRTSMGVIGNLRDYAQFQAAESMATAAANPGGGAAAAGVGLGAGMAMAQQMASAMNQGGQQAQAEHPGAGRANATPPPLPGAKTFFVAVDGQQQGPFNQDALTQMAAAGTLTRNSMVWSAGMPDWKPAGEVADLAKVFSSTPPPLPGAKK